MEAKYPQFAKSGAIEVLCGMADDVDNNEEDDNE
jgi:hypothetical protein